jgi:hypothetical protein
MKMPNYIVATRQRPIGVTLLSILAILGGIGFVGLGALTTFFLLSTDEPRVIAERLATIGIPLPLLIVGLAFLIVLSIGSGAGMWVGERWGWYLATFGYAYAIVRNLNAIWITHGIFSSLTPADMAAMPHGLGYYYFKFSARVVIAALILLYLFKINVREFFQVRDLPAWKVLAFEAVACSVIVAGVTLAASMLQST